MSWKQLNAMPHLGQVLNLKVAIQYCSNNLTFMTTRERDTGIKLYLFSLRGPMSIQMTLFCNNVQPHINAKYERVWCNRFAASEGVFPQAPNYDSVQLYTDTIPMDARPPLQHVNTEFCLWMTIAYTDGLVQERRNSSALAMELRLACTNPSICTFTMQ